MENKLLDGKLVAAEVLKKVKIAAQAYGKPVKLVVILIGHNPGSEIYVQQKVNMCNQLGFLAEIRRFASEQVKTAEVIELIKELNQDKSVNGILVQLPLPFNLQREAILEAVDPSKDVDGLHPYNLGQTFLGNEKLIPCTALGILQMLDFYGIKVEGKKVCVIGSGLVAGKPIALTMINRGATVSVLNSRTPKLSEFTAQADIVVSAAGQAKLINSQMIKSGAVLIDVGISRTENGKIQGDIDFADVLEKVSWISPVPGGVGKMTVACLMHNLLVAAKLQSNL